MPELCPTCVQILRELCRQGGQRQPQLCEIEARYVQTGDPDLVGQAAAIAPALAWRATKAVRSRVGKLA